MRKFFDVNPEYKLQLRPLVRIVVGIYYFPRLIKTSIKSFFRPFVHRFFSIYHLLRIYTRYLIRIVRFFGIPSIEAAASAGSSSDIGRASVGRQIVMLVVSDLRIDPRVEREARALAAANYQVTVLCPDPAQGGVLPAIDWGPNVKIKFLHWTAASFVSEYPGYLAIESYFEAARLRPFAFHAHDLNTAYAALAAAKHTGAHLVVDFHEWTSENVHWNVAKQQLTPYPDAWKADLQKLETRLLIEASAVVTVCDSIADALVDELGGPRRPSVIRNIPTLSAVPTRYYPPLKQQLGLPEDRFVLLWQGGTGPSRLIEPIIEALQFAPKCTFVIRGPSLDLYGKEYLAIAERTGASDRLILQDAVPSRDVVAAALGADAGIWTLPALCRNFTYALPNKIFEYMASNLPTLVADYPEARRLVMTHEVGLTFDPYDPRSIAAAINRLIDDPAFAQACRDNTVKALMSLNADGEWRKLVALYDNLPRSGSA